MSDEETRLRANFAAASAKLREGVTVRAGAQGYENAYAVAYQALVRGGYEPQLRGKYRA